MSTYPNSATLRDFRVLMSGSPIAWRHPNGPGAWPEERTNGIGYRMPLVEVRFGDHSYPETEKVGTWVGPVGFGLTARREANAMRTRAYDDRAGHWYMAARGLCICEDYRDDPSENAREWCDQDGRSMMNRDEQGNYTKNPGRDFITCSTCGVFHHWQWVH